MKSSFLSDGQEVVNFSYAEGEKGIEYSKVCWVAGKSLQKKQHMDEKHQQVFFASDCLFEDELTRNETKQQNYQNTLFWKPKPSSGTQVH